MQKFVTKIMSIRIPHIFSWLLALLIALIVAPGARAGASNKSGNPFGNGTFFNTGGTFNGVLRGTNVVGVTTFTTSTNSTLSGGPLYIYNAISGSYDDSWGVYPILDPSANTLTAFLASSNNPLMGISYTDTTGTTVYAANPIQTPLGAGGTFSANLKTTPPNQTYSGNGSINLTGVPQNFSINGCRIAN